MTTAIYELFKYVVRKIFNETVKFLTS